MTPMPQHSQVPNAAAPTLLAPTLGLALLMALPACGNTANDGPTPIFKPSTTRRDVDEPVDNDTTTAADAGAVASDGGGSDDAARARRADFRSAG